MRSCRVAESPGCNPREDGRGRERSRRGWFAHRAEPLCSNAGLDPGRKCDLPRRPLDAVGLRTVAGDAVALAEAGSPTERNPYARMQDLTPGRNRVGSVTNPDGKRREEAPGMEELAAGLWRWACPHPEWWRSHPWTHEVACFALARASSTAPSPARRSRRRVDGALRVRQDVAVERKLAWYRTGIAPTLEPLLDVATARVLVNPRPARARERKRRARAGARGGPVELPPGRQLRATPRRAAGYGEGPRGTTQ
jgi:hypothetical protein